MYFNIYLIILLNVNYCFSQKYDSYSLKINYYTDNKCINLNNIIYNNFNCIHGEISIKCCHNELLKYKINTSNINKCYKYNNNSINYNCSVYEENNKKKDFIIWSIIFFIFIIFIVLLLMSSDKNKIGGYISINDNKSYIYDRI